MQSQEEPKYSLSAPTQEEQSNFMKDLQAVVEKHEMYFEPIPQLQRKDLTSPWEIACAWFLQKKTPIVEKTEEGTPSPFQE